MMILSFYASYFVLALPFLRRSPRVLLVLAGFWAIAGPVVSFFVRSRMDPADEAGGALSLRDLTSLASAGKGFLRLFVDGAYPALTWMPFVLAGLEVGGVDLRSVTVRLRLLATDVGLAVLGHGGSWLALHVFGGNQALQPIFDALRPIAEQIGKDPLTLLQMSNYGVVPTSTPAFLVLDGPHSGTPFEIVCSVGWALAVLAICLFVGGRSGAILSPLIAVGALALTVYLALRVLEQSAGPALQAHPWLPLLGLVAATLVCCGLWRPFLGRGPVERLMHWASTRAATVLVRADAVATTNARYRDRR